METGSQLVWRPDPLVTRCGSESQHPAEWAPRPPIEQPRRTGKKRSYGQIEWGSLCCSSVQSPTHSHTQPFQIKWEVYFCKNCVAYVYFVVMILHAYVDVYVSCVCTDGCDYTTCDYTTLCRWLWLYNNDLVFEASFHATCVTRIWVDDPRSGQRQEKCGTWKVSERKFQKFPAKKKRKGQTNNKEQKKRKRTKEKLQHAGWKEEKRDCK